MMAAENEKAHSMKAAREVSRAMSSKWGAMKETAAAARQDREKAIDNTIDGRSLRATGRNAQFNFRARPTLRDEAMTVAKAQGLSLAEFMEKIIQNAIDEHNRGAG